MLRGAVYGNVTDAVKPPTPTAVSYCNMAVYKQLIEFLGLNLYFFKIDQSPYILWASLLDPCISLQQVLYNYQDDPELLPEIHKQNIRLEQYYEANFAGKIQ
ncbi:hypothetical protein M422DRAFT_245373 [Sphaerobolus stellatus SS14]|nr:hypothetical protein M422DRAFT_245373 [Sphaerobolus stellatus SS14]